MSNESMEWLQTMIMVGNGYTPWHSQDKPRDQYPNLYDGPLDRDEIRSKLLGWVPNVEKIYDADSREITGYIRLVPSDDSTATLGIHTEAYAVHEYGELLDISPLDVASSGLLKQRRIFWVTFSADGGQTVSTPEGVDFLPYVTASTSLDGSMSTAVHEHCTLPVCDNTLQIARIEGEKFKIKHSSKSGTSWVSDATKAAAALAKLEEDMSAEIATLCGQSVTEKQWQLFMDEWCPLPEKSTSKGGGPGRGYTMAENRRIFMDELYHTDNRVSPWSGTAFGVLQAVNTYATHHSIVRDTGQDEKGAIATRVQRNMLRTVTNKWAEVDQSTLSTLDKILQTV